jgi:DNA-binding NtrC family response regulator
MARILIIDDESNIRMMLRLALQHVGHTVETAADGPEGLEKFGEGGAAWDVALLDQRMPGMEGLEVLREMRRRDPDARIIMITAFGTIDLAEEALQAGATDFLRKPFTVDTLRGAVQAALTGGAPAREETASFLSLWAEGNPLAYLLRFLLLGQGDTAPVTHEVIRQTEANPERRPALHVGGWG